MAQATNSFGLSDVRHVVAVSSCKGGVGKSTVAAGLARALAAQGFKTGILDADIHGPSLPTLFHLPQAQLQANEFKMLKPIEAEGLKLMSFGFLLGDAPAVMRGPIVTRYIQQLLFQTDWGKLDYLIVDMPPGTGDVQLTITQSVRLTGAVIVTTRQTLSLVDVARGILMFEKVQVPILGIVDNMAYFVCDDCQKKHFLFGATDVQERFGVRVLTQIPLLPSLNLHTYMEAASRAMQEAIKIQALASQTLPQIRFDAQSVGLKFADGKEVTFKNRDLRALCRCALCVNELSGKSLLDLAAIRPDIAAKEILPLGNYAIGITWNDGHSSGIYPYTIFQK